MQHNASFTGQSAHKSNWIYVGRCDYTEIEIYRAKEDSTKLDCGSLKESKGAVVEIKSIKDAVKDKEEQDPKIMRIVHKRH